MRLGGNPLDAKPRMLCCELLLSLEEGRILGLAVEVQDADKRPVAAVADHDEVRSVRSVDVSMDHSISLNMLFDPGHNLDERILSEQFGF